MINKSGYDVPTGDFMQINIGGQVDPRTFFTEQSSPSKALLDRVRLKAGYGIVATGLLAVNSKGEYVPYVPTTFANDISRTMAVADVGTGATTVSIVAEESTKYAVGDTLILANDAALYHDCGLITDVSTVNGLTAITFTNATATTAFTVANNTHIYEKAGADGKFSTPVVIMWHPADTGSSLELTNKGAIAEILISHAQFYKHAVWNYDDAAKAALGTAIVDLGNQHLSLR